MCTSIEDQLREQLKIFKDCHNQLLKKLAKEQEKNKKLRSHHKSLTDLMQQLNCSVMKKNRVLIEKSHMINKFLNDLYEAIDEYYTETLERNDELAIARAEAQLKLIKEIIDRVEKI